MKRLIGTPLLALFALLPLALASCSNPSSAPGTSTTTVTPAAYSASVFFNTQSLGDTSSVPFPFCFPVQYLQQKLGLTDTEVLDIQNLQDSLRLALQTQIAALKASGKLTPDSVRAYRLEYETVLYMDVAAILTPAQLAALNALQPPLDPPNHFGRGPMPGPGRRRDNDPNDTARVQLTAAQRDSVMLSNLETGLAAVGDTLTANQITLIQNLLTTIEADTTLTPQARHSEFDAQIQTILTAKQLADIQALAQGDNRGRWRHR
jgi:hypothetical protein